MRKWKRIQERAQRTEPEEMPGRRRKSGQSLQRTGLQGRPADKKKRAGMAAVLIMAAFLSAALLGCGQKEQGEEELTILAAASLTDVCNEIKALYEKENPGVRLTFSYGASGALQTQIEEGAPADLFIPAAEKQMEALKEKGLIDAASVVKLLENKVVLIVPRDSEKAITSFEAAADDEVKIIGLGEPASVPVGQYSEEIFTSLGLWDQVKKKANYGSDVRTVLSWVEEGAVDCGVVYATDAYVGEGIRIVCEAPEGSCRKVIYPAGIVKSSENPAAAADFLTWLSGDEAMELFEAYGFSKMQ